MFIRVSLGSPTLQHVAPNLYFGDLEAAHRAPLLDAAMVHACKEPCHKQAVGYSASLPPHHPEYLAAERGLQLYLNMIDPPLPLFKPAMFATFFAFVDRHIAMRPVVIHCNQGRSRAPSLALLYMAKRLKLLPDTDYAAARQAFEQRFPYSPGAGIASFLSDHWAPLGA